MKIAATVADTIATLWNGVVRRIERRAIDAAVQRAHAAFARSQPELAESLFDLHFVRRRVRREVERATLGEALDVEAFAEAWIAQWAFADDISDRRKAHALPAIREFAAALEHELSQAGLIRNVVTPAAATARTT